MAIDKIGPYKVVFPFGKIGNEALYRVTDENGNRRFLKLYNLAKINPLQYDGNPTNITEPQVVKSLNHANILSYVDDDECIINGQRFHYLVFDFIVGETVAAKLDREKVISVYDAKQIVLGVLNALKYLHAQSPVRIYNGIDPRNVMIDLSNDSINSKLINFSHSQLLDKFNKQFYADGINPFFNAPELFKGLYSTRTDLYAVGALLYSMTFGIAPWYIDLSKIQPSKRAEAILNEQKHPIKIPSLNIFELDENLLNIIIKSLKQDVDERFQTAEEFINALNGETEIPAGEYTVLTQEETVQKPKEKKEKKGNGFADVAGMHDLKKRLLDEVIDLLRQPEKYTRLRVQIPNGILLYGPPGCGKTFIGEKLAEEMGCNYMYVHCSDVASPYIHGGQEKIASLFQEAKESAPTVLFLDELDAMIANRSMHNNVSEYGEVNEFLTHLNNCADNQIFVIGATNHPENIDPAALRSGRLDMKFYVPMPDKEARKELFLFYLKDRSDESIDIDLLAEKTEGYVAKDICVLVNHAARLTVKRDEDLISQETMLESISSSKGELPSVSSATVAQNERMKDVFEGKKNSKLPRVGFITDLKDHQ